MDRQTLERVYLEASRSPALARKHDVLAELPEREIAETRQPSASAQAARELRSR